MKHNFIPGCNLSPLLFSIFIDSLGTELNLSKLGIPLSSVNVSAILFADDIVLIGKDSQALSKLMGISRRFFSSHHLELSTAKSKVMTYNASTGETTFTGSQDIPDVTLEQVVVYKYLGISVSSAAHGFFRAHNEKVKAKARQYLQSVLSLVKSGPDRSDLAYTLWTSCALPSILYGCEVVPFDKGTIQEIESCQARIGKFILQIPTSSSNVISNIDCGFRPVWSVVAERVMIFAKKLMDKPVSYWPKLAYEYHLSIGSKSRYLKYLNMWREKTNSFGVPIKQIRKNVNHSAIKNVYENQRATCVTSFALSCPGKASHTRWFYPKPWVSDSCFTKIFAEFRACNAGLGNRGPTKDGRFFKICPLCSEFDGPHLNNEVRMFYKNLLLPLIFIFIHFLLLFLRGGGGTAGHHIASISSQDSIPKPHKFVCVFSPSIFLGITYC